VKTMDSRSTNSTGGAKSRGSETRARRKSSESAVQGDLDRQNEIDDSILADMSAGSSSPPEDLTLNELQADSLRLQVPMISVSNMIYRNREGGQGEEPRQFQFDDQGVLNVTLEQAQAFGEFEEEAEASFTGESEVSVGGLSSGISEGADGSIEHMRDRESDSAVKKSKTPRDKSKKKKPSVSKSKKSDSIEEVLSVEQQRLAKKKKSSKKPPPSSEEVSKEESLRNLEAVFALLGEPAVDRGKEVEVEELSQAAVVCLKIAASLAQAMLLSKSVMTPETSLLRMNCTLNGARSLEEDDLVLALAVGVLGAGGATIDNLADSQVWALEVVQLYEEGSVPGAVLRMKGPVKEVTTVNSVEHFSEHQIGKLFSVSPIPENVMIPVGDLRVRIQEAGCGPEVCGMPGGVREGSNRDKRKRTSSKDIGRRIIDTSQSKCKGRKGGGRKPSGAGGSDASSGNLSPGGSERGWYSSSGSSSDSESSVESISNNIGSSRSLSNRTEQEKGMAKKKTEDKKGSYWENPDGKAVYTTLKGEPGDNEVALNALLTRVLTDKQYKALVGQSGVLSAKKVKERILAESHANNFALSSDVTISSNNELLDAIFAFNDDAQFLKFLRGGGWCYANNSGHGLSCYRHTHNTNPPVMGKNFEKRDRLELVYWLKNFQHLELRTRSALCAAEWDRLILNLESECSTLAFVRNDIVKCMIEDLLFLWHNDVLKNVVSTTKSLAHILLNTPEGCAALLHGYIDIILSVNRPLIYQDNIFDQKRGVIQVEFVNKEKAGQSHVQYGWGTSAKHQTYKKALENKTSNKLSGGPTFSPTSTVTSPKQPKVKLSSGSVSVKEKPDKYCFFLLATMLKVNDPKSHSVYKCTAAKCTRNHNFVLNQVQKQDYRDMLDKKREGYQIPFQIREKFKELC